MKIISWAGWVSNFKGFLGVLVTVRDTGGTPRAGLKVYAFDGSTYTGHSATTDTDGQAALTLPDGDYRFRADYNGTQFWSGVENHCNLPGCSAASITVTIPLTVTVAGQTGQPYAGLKVYAFDGPTYTGYNGTSDENGQVTFTLPQGSYRFRADYDSVQFWSGTTNHFDIPGCSSATITLPGSLVDTNVTIDYALRQAQGRRTMDSTG